MQTKLHKSSFTKFDNSNLIVYLLIHLFIHFLIIHTCTHLVIVFNDSGLGGHTQHVLLVRRRRRRHLGGTPGLSPAARARQGVAVGWGGGVAINNNTSFSITALRFSFSQLCSFHVSRRMSSTTHCSGVGFSLLPFLKKLLPHHLLCRRLIHLKSLFSVIHLIIL